jgi:hypothetical protein
MKYLLSVVVFTLLSCGLLGQTVSGGVNWNSHDESSLTVQVGPGSVFEYTNPDGTKIYLTGGTQGASLSLVDRKDKGGSIWIALGKQVSLLDWIANAMNPDYGMNGEPALLLEGLIKSGSGAFDMELVGFEGVENVTWTFTAVLVSDGNDNPLAASIYGQGDQLAFPTPGTLSYTTKWHSEDELLLSNGDVLIPGDFYLNSYAEPSVFSYSVALPDIASTFTIGESYLFVYDLSLPPTGGKDGNLRCQMDGSVTKDLVGTFIDIIPTLSEWGVIILLLLVLAVGMAFLYKRKNSLALAGTGEAEVSNVRSSLFNLKLFFKAFGIVLLIGVIGLAASFWYFGQINIADPFGVFVSAAVVAYMVQLHILRKARDNM